MFLQLTLMKNLVVLPFLLIAFASINAQQVSRKLDYQDKIYNYTFRPKKAANKYELAIDVEQNGAPVRVYEAEAIMSGELAPDENLRIVFFQAHLKQGAWQANPNSFLEVTYFLENESQTYYAEGEMLKLSDGILTATVSNETGTLTRELAIRYAVDYFIINYTKALLEVSGTEKNQIQPIGSAQALLDSAAKKPRSEVANSPTNDVPVIAAPNQEEGSASIKNTNWAFTSQKKELPNVSSLPPAPAASAGSQPVDAVANKETLQNPVSEVAATKESPATADPLVAPGVIAADPKTITAPMPVPPAGPAVKKIQYWLSSIPVNFSQARSIQVDKRIYHIVPVADVSNRGRAYFNLTLFDADSNRTETVYSSYALLYDSSTVSNKYDIRIHLSIKNAYGMVQPYPSCYLNCSFNLDEVKITYQPVSKMKDFKNPMIGETEQDVLTLPPGPIHRDAIIEMAFKHFITHYSQLFSR